MVILLENVDFCFSSLGTRTAPAACFSPDWWQLREAELTWLLLVVSWKRKGTSPQKGSCPLRDEGARRLQHSQP